MSLASPLTPASRGGRRYRRRRFSTRALPLIALAVAAFAAGALAGSRHEPPDRRTATRFAKAWAAGDRTAMYAELAQTERARISADRFRRAYEEAAETSTLEKIRLAGPLVEVAERAFDVQVVASTRVFGDLRGRLRIELTGDEEVSGVVWSRAMTFPGLLPGERLTRDVSVPPRGRLQTREGLVLAAGEARLPDPELGSLAAEVAGRVGPIPPEQADAYAAKGYPPDAVVGLTGLERQFETRLAGRFGGTLRAGGRVLAEVKPHQGGAVRTSIDADIERAAVAALAGRFGGIAVMRPRTGEVLALAGIAYSAPQPPGSTFKIVTLAGALDAGVVKRSDSFPVQTFATLEGVELENANGESCGGSLAVSFAHSCNSVFAPIGARLGAKRLVAAAERFGFNEDSDIEGAPPGSIPAPDEIGDDLAVGSSAIGQGVVTATPLRMAMMASAIANHGVLVRPTLLRGGQGRRSRATKAATARTIRAYMELVVRDGTGGAAAIPGVRVAGKTGTAELRDTTPEDDLVEPGEEPPPPEDDTTDTDAWFVAFAPAGKPRVAVAVLLVGQGAGGTTAAPAARVVLDAAL